MIEGLFSTIRLSLTTLAKALQDRDKEALKRLKNVRNETIKDIDSLQDRCLREIALRQPFGKEFRRLAALMKISTSLERIARYVSHAAEYSLETIDKVPENILNKLARMAYLADKALNDSIEAFTREDLNMLKRSEEIEEELDKEFDSARNLIISRGEDSCNVRPAILAVIARSVERIGDHAIEIVRRTEYYLKGTLPHARS